MEKLTDEYLKRFIPTGVGNTIHAVSGPTLETVHPHGRGEYTLFSSPPRKSNGSSPRAWGIRDFISGLQDAGRFIPTGVGNTHDSASFSHAVTVHPHGRGEYMMQRPRSRLRSGSSPRAWGIHISDLNNPTDEWFIPTGVGNTAVNGGSAAIQ